MEVKVEKLEKNRVSLEVELGADQVDKALDQAYRRVVKKVNIPGFRKGRVPRKILEMRLGKGVLYEEAVEILLPEAYAKAVEEASLEPIDQPQIEDIQIEEGSPFRFSATVEVKPEVKLGQYKGLPVERKKAEVSEEEVDNFLENLRERTATWRVVEEGEAEDGDLVIIDFTGYVDGEPLQGGKGENHSLVLGSGSFIPGFEEQLVGAKSGEERKIQVTFPEDYHNQELAGVEAEFNVQVKEIKRKELAALDDEFAKDVSEFATLEELKEDIRKKLLEAAENKAESEFREELVKTAAANAEVEIPEVMVKRRVENMINDLEHRLQQQGLSLDVYLNIIDKTLENLREEFEEAARESVKIDLVLEAIAKAEGIETKEEEIEAELDTMVAGFAEEEDKLRELKERLRESGHVDLIADNLIRRKTIDLLAAGVQAS
ncbi:MAG: trigger factor [bacterium]|nr:trigger factor [Bacillota bacterium]HHW54404.1 trigger factor [Bacillota bacterium]